MAMMLSNAVTNAKIPTELGMLGDANTVKIAQVVVNAPIRNAPSQIAQMPSGTVIPTVMIAGVNGALAKKADGMAILRPIDPTQQPVLPVLECIAQQPNTMPSAPTVR